MDELEFVEELEKIGLICTAKELEKLNKYYEELKEWNTKINLTAITEKKEVYLKHFYDSLTLSKAIDLNNVENLCDVGSGAGFPGIVIKIFFPSIKVTLIDSLNKRVIFLNHLITKLNLQQIEAKHVRMEDYSKENEEVFDLITARAVANISVLAEISVRSLKVGGKLILLKAHIDEELKNSKPHLEKLSLKYINTISFSLPKEESKRNIVIFKKEKTTTKIYPRSIDKIKKELSK